MEFLGGNPQVLVRNLRPNILDGRAGDKNGANEDSGSEEQSETSPVSKSGYFS